MTDYVASGKRHQQTAPGEHTEQVYVLDAMSAAIGNGRGYIVGSGRVTLSVAGNVRGVVQNPAGSGRNVTVVGFSAFATAVGYAQLYENPTVGVPATASRTGMGLRPASDARVSTVRVDTNATTALSGGTDTGIVIGLPAGARTEIARIGKILAPGETLGISIPFTGSADLAFALYIAEE
jgi:hypothetical protein